MREKKRNAALEEAAQLAEMGARYYRSYGPGDAESHGAANALIILAEDIRSLKKIKKRLDTK